MSLATWKKEFYSSKTAIETGIAALQHSLKKWRGATKANLKKHKCVTLNEKRLIFEDGTFVFNDSTCALCYLYYSSVDDCQNCPLFILEETPCFKVNSTGKNPYLSFTSFKDPKPMIALIRRALNKALKDEKRKK